MSFATAVQKGLFAGVQLGVAYVAVVKEIRLPRTGHLQILHPDNIKPDELQSNYVSADTPHLPVTY